MEKLTQIINLIVAIISGLVLLGTIVSLVIKWLKEGNWKKINVLFTQIPYLVTEAEKMFGAGHGLDKLKWVMTELRNLAYKTKTCVSDEVLKEQINLVVDTTNNVNVDKFPFAEDCGVAEEVVVPEKNDEPAVQLLENLEIKGDEENA